MKLRNKKGFTIIELVIVIAVIGVLTAVLVPTFVNLTQRANQTSDQSLVKNLNTAMQAQEGESGKKNSTYNDAITYLDNYGYRLANLATKAGEDLLWNSKSNRFLLNNAEAVATDKTQTGAEYVDYWTIKDAIPEGSKYSIYAGLNFQEPEGGVVIDGIGFDAGSHNFSKISYTNSSSAKEVVIRTNSAATSLTIDDKSEGSIRHYGSAGSLNIIECHTSSYHENGKVAYAEISYGRIVLESGSKIEEVHVNKKDSASFDTVIIANNGGAAELPDRITRDAVTVTVETLVVKVEANGASENVYVYADGATGKTNKVTEGENKQNENVNSALGQLVLDNGTNPGEKAQTTEQKQAAKTDIIDAAVDKEAVEADESGFWIVCHADAFADGSGTELDPYIIKTARQLSLLAYNVNTLQAGYASAYYRLEKDIDLSGKAWTPIGTTNGTNTLFFTGHFDGNGKSIIGLTNNDKSDADLGLYSDELSSVKGLAASYGLFGFTQNVNISDLTMESASIDGPSYFKEAGIIIGMATGSTIMTNCTVDGDSSISGKSKIGGLIGYVNLSDSDNGLGGNVNLTNCDFAGAVTVSADRAGALVGAFCAHQSGYNLGHTHVFKDCDSTGTVSSGTYGTGLIGFIYQGGAKNTYGIKSFIFDNCSADTSKFSTNSRVGKYIGRHSDATSTIIIKGTDETYSTNLIGDLNSYGSFILCVNGQFYGYKYNQSGASAMPSLDSNIETYKVSQMITNAPGKEYEPYWKTDRMEVVAPYMTLIKIDETSLDVTSGELKYGAGWYDTLIADFSSFVAEGYHVVAPEYHATYDSTGTHYIWQVVADSE